MVILLVLEHDDIKDPLYQYVKNNYLLYNFMINSCLFSLQEFSNVSFINKDGWRDMVAFGTTLSERIIVY